MPSFNDLAAALMASMVALVPGQAASFRLLWPLQRVVFVAANDFELRSSVGPESKV